MSRALLFRQFPQRAQVVSSYLLILFAGVGQRSYSTTYHLSSQSPALTVKQHVFYSLSQIDVCADIEQKSLQLAVIHWPPWRHWSWTERSSAWCVVSQRAASTSCPLPRQFNAHKWVTAAATKWNLSYGFFCGQRFHRLESALQRRKKRHILGSMRRIKVRFCDIRLWSVFLSWTQYNAGGWRFNLWRL